MISFGKMASLLLNENAYAVVIKYDSHLSRYNT